MESSFYRRKIQMGIAPFSSCDIPSSDPLAGIGLFDSYKDSPANPPRLPNPDPRNFVIEKVRCVGGFAIVLAHYPDCTNYEGKKILVFENMDEKSIRELKVLDPHFCEHRNHPSPVARFKPTQKGWGYAVEFCKSMAKKKAS